MRLIDADALINRIVFYTDLPFEMKEAVEDEINEQPIIEPEPKKGKWLLHTDERFDIDYYKCSECGYEPYRKMDISNFCPNCGCQMNGGEQE